MARWNAWLCRFGMPGRTTPGTRSALRRVGTDANLREIAPFVDLQPYRIGEALGQQRCLRPEHRHG